MIPYEQLVAQLADWRARNGLAMEQSSSIIAPASPQAVVSNPTETIDLADDSDMIVDEAASEQSDLSSPVDTGFDDEATAMHEAAMPAPPVDVDMDQDATQMHAVENDDGATQMVDLSSDDGATQMHELDADDGATQMHVIDDDIVPPPDAEDELAGPPAVDFPNFEETTNTSVLDDSEQRPGFLAEPGEGQESIDLERLNDEAVDADDFIIDEEEES